jgi:hypothetical protein
LIAELEQKQMQHNQVVNCVNQDFIQMDLDNVNHVHWVQYQQITELNFALHVVVDMNQTHNALIVNNVFQESFRQTVLDVNHAWITQYHQDTVNVNVYHAELELKQTLHWVGVHYANLDFIQTDQVDAKSAQQDILHQNMHLILVIRALVALNQMQQTKFVFLAKSGTILKKVQFVYRVLLALYHQEKVSVDVKNVESDLRQMDYSQSVYYVKQDTIQMDLDNVNFVLKEAFQLTLVLKNVHSANAVQVQISKELNVIYVLLVNILLTVFVNHVLSVQ